MPDNMVLSKCGITINRIDWIVENYSPCLLGAKHLLIYPAMTPVFVFAFLEFLSVISFGISKKFWQLKAKIELSFDKKTTAPRKLVSEFIDAYQKSNEEIIDFTNRIAELESTKQKLSKEKEELLSENEIMKSKLSEIEIELQMERFDHEDKNKSDKAIKTIFDSTNKNKIILEFKRIRDKISAEQNGCADITKPSAELIGLETMGVFIRDKDKNCFKLTKIGEYVNLYILLNYNDNV
ncbi:MAG: hypothetical protein IPI23_19360 [Bacteroidetes bacterium]|nr:hypothetical protein [Bacteroidota bacterium]